MASTDIRALKQLIKEIRDTDAQTQRSFQDFRTPNEDRDTDGHDDTSNDKVTRRLSSCSPVSARRLMTILSQRIRTLKNLGVRVIVTSERLRKALQRTGKVVKTVNEKSGNDSALCQEQSKLVTIPADVEATVAYEYYSVSCAQEQCFVYGLPFGLCQRKTVSVVVPVYKNCRPFSQKTLIFGCACRCIRST